MESHSHSRKESKNSKPLTIRTAGGQVVNVLNESPSPSPTEKSVPAPNSAPLSLRTPSTGSILSVIGPSPSPLSSMTTTQTTLSSYQSPLSAQYRNLPSAGISDQTALMSLHTPRKSLTYSNSHMYSPYQSRNFMHSSGTSPHGALFAANLNSPQPPSLRPNSANALLNSSMNQPSSMHQPLSSRPQHRDVSTFLSDKLGLKSSESASSLSTNDSESTNSQRIRPRSISELKGLTVKNLEELSKYLGPKSIDEPMSDDPKRPFACPVEGCTSVFATRTHRKRHIQTVHIKAKPFQCIYPGCTRTFSREDNMHQHVRLFHQRQPRGVQQSSEAAEAAAVLASIDERPRYAIG